MANDRIKFSVHITPIEELAREEGSDTTPIIASEVGTSLGGSGDSVDLANYSGALVAQGYKDGAVGYLDCVHTTAGVAVSTRAEGDFFFIKNTGFKFSSATVLGASTTDCVMLVISIILQSGSNGGWEKADGTSETHYVEIAWLKPGQAIVLPCAASSITNFGMTSGKRFGANDNDLTVLNDTSGADSETSVLSARTYQSDGSAASDGNALEFLSVT